MILEYDFGYHRDQELYFCEVLKMFGDVILVIRISSSGWRL